MRLPTVAVALPAPNDNTLWLSRYNGSGKNIDSAQAVAVSPGGSRVFVTGRSFGLLGEGRDYATVAYAATTGQELWGPQVRAADSARQDRNSGRGSVGESRS